MNSCDRKKLKEKVQSSWPMVRGWFDQLFFQTKRNGSPPKLGVKSALDLTCDDECYVHSISSKMGGFVGENRFPNFILEFTVRIYPNGKTGGFYVECCNGDCGWEGKSTECVTFKHVPEERLCPKCNEVVEPRE